MHNANVLETLKMKNQFLPNIGTCKKASLKVNVKLYFVLGLYRPIQKKSDKARGGSRERGFGGGGLVR